MVFYSTEIPSAAASSPPVDKENLLRPTSHQQNGNVPKKTSWSPQVAHHMEDSFFGYQEMVNARSSHYISIFSFCKKIICPPGISVTPCRGNTFLFCSSQHLPSLGLGGALLTRCPSKALNLDALLPEIQRYKDTVRCAALGAEVPGHCQQQLTQTLIVHLLKTHFFTPFLDCEKSTE